MELRGTAVFLCLAAWPLAAQGPAWDSSGNGQLNGSFYFRQVLYVGGGTPSLSRAISVYGGIQFNGSGSYTISGAQIFDSNAGAPQNFSTSGTYSISASGLGFLSSPAESGQQIYVLVSNGIVIGSTTETSSGYNDLFVAAPLGSSQPTVSSLNGTYQAAYYATSGDAVDDVDAMIQMSADGAGHVNASMNGYNGAGATGTQISTNLKYIYSNGAAVITFPNSNTAPFIYNENEYLYMSPDGNFIFGGSPTDYDMFVGVKTSSSGSQNLSGLYYQAGLDEDDSQIASNVATLNTWYGSFSAFSGNTIGHQRLGTGQTAGTGYTYSGTYPASISGGYTDQTTSLQYVFSANGAIRIGLGIGPYLGINVALQAPTLSGSGVYLNPQSISNSASSAPFTAGISDGEFITLYGSNLAQSTVVASVLPFPPTLGGVQVMINGINAPIYYVSPGQISVIVPFENTFPVAQIQVINGSGSSNVITAFVNKTTPGIFTISSSFGGLGPGGIGYAAAEHADYSVVSDANPAQPGETVQLYLTGLGSVYPTNPDGAAGPTSPYSLTTNTISLDLDGTAAPAPAFVGLAPALAGLYQINFEIPTTMTSGQHFIDVAGPDSYTSEAVIPVGSGTSSAASAARPAARFPRGAERKMVQGRAPIQAVRRPPLSAR